MNWLTARMTVLLSITIIVALTLILVWAFGEPTSTETPAKSESVPPTVVPRVMPETASRSYGREPWPRVETGLTPSSKPKEKAKPKPKSKVTPQPTPTPLASKKPEPTKPLYTKAPANATMACIREHESGGNYRIMNSLGYQGAYQLSPTYSPAWAKRYGYPEYASKPAHTWPPAVQDSVALQLGQQTHWRMWSDFTTYHCPGFIS